MQMSKQKKIEQASQWLRTVPYSLVSLTGGSIGVDGQSSGTRLLLRADGTPHGILRECVEASYLPEFSTITDKTRITSGMAESGPWYHLYSRWDIDRNTGRLSLLRTFSSDKNDISAESGMKSSCGVFVTVKYFYEQPALVDMATLEHYGEQGWSFDRGGVRRDPTSNLYDYYVAVSHRLTVVTPEHLFSSNALELVYATEYKGLYGGIGTPKNHLGASVALPSGAEIRYERSHDEEFCTWDVRVLRSIKRPVSKLRESIEDTSVAKTTTLVKSGQASPLGAPAAPGGGVVRTNVSELGSDGTWTNTEEARVEKLGAESEAKQVSLGFVEETKEEIRAQPLPMPDDSEVGITVRNEKTLGRFFKTLRTSFRVIVGFVMAKSKEENLFQSVTEEMTRVSEAPEPEAFAGNGTVVKVDGVRDERGGWRKTRRAVQEKPIDKSSETVTGIPEGIIRVTEGVLSESDPSVESAAVNESVKRENTPGKFVSFVRTVFEFVDRGRLTASRREDVSSRDTVTKRAVPSWTEPLAAFHKGRIVRETCELTDRGYQKSIEQQEAKPYRGNPVVLSDDLTETVTATPMLEQTSVPPASVNGRAIKTNSNVTITPFGHINGVQVDRVLKKMTNPEHILDETWNSVQVRDETVNDDEESVPVGGLFNAGQSGAFRVTLAREKSVFGFFSWKRTKITPVKRRVAFEWWQRGRYTKQVLIFNYTEGEVVAEHNAFPSGNISGVSHDVRPNEFGLFSGSITVAYDSESGGNIGASFSKSVTESKYAYVSDEGVLKAVKITYAVTYQKGYGVSHGLSDYGQGVAMEGSSFQQLGDNGYFFRKVTSVLVTRAQENDVNLVEE